VAKLIYSAIASLDGYVADENGEFGWARPDEEVHRFVNEQERPIGTYLYGRRMYEVMKAWASDELIAGEPEVMRQYAEIWRGADKVVYSRTLKEAETARTRVERDFDPEALGQLKTSAERDLSVGGPTIAAEALRAQLVDEIRLILAPVVAGGGTRALPEGLRLDLELLGERRFANGFVFLGYSVTTMPVPSDQSSAN
jgi:dihydrofolate reductase